MNLFALVVPLTIASIALFAAFKKVDVYSALTTGASEGLKTVAGIVPALVALLTAISMFRASGAMELIVNAVSPAASLLGLPSECLPLMLMRPLSGSGGLAIGSDIIRAAGPESYVGRVAAVMLGSTETTFYTIAVYFGAAKISRTRHTIPAALTADLVGFIAAAFSVRLFFGA